MRKSISPEVLRQLREEKGWSLKDLAHKARIDLGTIHRIEQGKQPRQRQSTIDALCTALAVDESVLTGRTPRMRVNTEGESPLVSKQQLNIRIDTSARNALMLIARRYNMQVSQIVEVAPLLFLLAAERSLLERREKLAKVDATIAEIGASHEAFPHLPASAFWKYFEGLEHERKSITERDLFGEVIDEAPIHDGENEYEEHEQNPFVVFLRQQATNVATGAEVTGWSHYGSPDYRICVDDALAIVGGDVDAADAILSGAAPLQELPKELRAKDRVAERASWIRARGEETRQQSHKDLVELLGHDPNLQASLAAEGKS